MGNYAIWFGFLITYSGGNSWCPCIRSNKYTFPPRPSEPKTMTTLKHKPNVWIDLLITGGFANIKKYISFVIIGAPKNFTTLLSCKIPINDVPFSKSILKRFSMFFGDTFIFCCLMALEKSFALSAQYLGRLDICGGNIRAFHILSVGGYLVAWALNCSPSHDLPCVCAELTHTWFPSQHHANTYNLTLNTTR